MNLERLNQAISIMERAGNVYMGFWSDIPISSDKTEKEYHSCGTAACFAGWVAVSPEFQRAGGTVRFTGCPEYQGESAEWAILAWLEIPITSELFNLTRLLIMGIIQNPREPALIYETLDKIGVPYETDSTDTAPLEKVELSNWEDYTAKDVIKCLNALKDLSDSTQSK